MCEGASSTSPQMPIQAMIVVTKTSKHKIPLIMAGCSHIEDRNSLYKRYILRNSQGPREHAQRTPYHIREAGEDASTQTRARLLASACAEAAGPGARRSTFPRTHSLDTVHVLAQPYWHASAEFFSGHRQVCGQTIASCVYGNI